MAGNNTDWGVPGNNITQPPFAGPNEPAIVIGPDVPAELVAYYAPGGREVTSAIIFRRDADDYLWMANVFRAATAGNTIRVGRTSAGVVKELQRWSYSGATNDNFNVEDPITGGDINATFDLTAGSFSVLAGNITFNGDLFSVITDAFQMIVNGSPQTEVFLPGEPVYITATDASWPVPPNIRGGWVELQAAGGPGAGAAATGVGESSVGTGGGSGANVRKFFTAAELGSTVNITIGAAGTGSAGAVGTAAANSTFDPAGTGGTLTATGGKTGSVIAAGTGASVTGPGGTQATASGGDVNINGESGTAALRIGGTDAGGGWGASSPLGAGGRAGSTNAVGNAGTGYGAGGGGARNGASQSARAGGDGAPAVCIFIPAG